MSALEGANLPGATSLIEELDNKVLVILRDGRHFAGHLASLDQFCTSFSSAKFLCPGSRAPFC